MFGESLVAIDGSKFKAMNNRDRNFTSAKLKRRMEEIESSINRYLAALDAADRQVPSASEPDAASLEEKVAKLKAQMKELQGIESQLNKSPDKQVSLTDPDARSMMTRGNGIVGYNVQTAVDTQHHLIVAHEVTNSGSDRDQLSSMAKQARETMASETLSVVADRGYFKSAEILACHDANITAYIPKPMTSGAKADGRFNKDAFIYNTAKYEYTCPAGEALTRSKSQKFCSEEYCVPACFACNLAMLTVVVHRQGNKAESAVHIAKGRSKNS
ncbi:Transposase DDE domain protein [compost metagenome]